MRILAIETTGLTGSVAALQDGALLAQAVLRADQRSAQSLAPAIAELLRGLAWRPAEIQLIAVALGPGSFTGLRIGVTTAKTLAYAVSAEVLGVNTLEVLATQVPPDFQAAKLATVVDAQRQELFSGIFRSGAGGDWEWHSPPSVMAVGDWLQSLTMDTVVNGPALEKLGPRIPAGVVIAPCDGWAPTAAAVGQLAWRQYQAGRRDDLWQLTPLYLRKSAAEEKAAGIVPNGQPRL